MRTDQHQPHLPLLAFFETVFLPLELRNRGAQYAEQFRTAIRWLAATVQRQPRIEDFNKQTMRDAIMRLAAAGLAAATVRCVRQRLWRIWAYAFQLGYAGQAPPAMRVPKVPKYCHHGASGLAFVLINNRKVYLGRHGTQASRAKYLKKIAEIGATGDSPVAMLLPPASGPPPRLWLIGDPPPESLLHFYRHMFRPQLRPQLPAKELGRYDAAINHFHDFVGTQIQLADVAPDLVDNFRAWLDGLPLSDGQRCTYRGALRRVMRAADPERFPKLDGCYPKSAVGETERRQRDGHHGEPGHSKRMPDPIGEPGTLLHFLLHSYLREVAAGCSRQYRGNLLCVFRKMRLCFGRDLRFDELGREMIVELRAYLQETNGPVTVKKDLAGMKAVWRYANELGLAPDVPTFRRTKIPRDAPDAWSLDELSQIVAAARSIDRPPIGGIPVREYYPALILVGWYTALRRRSLAEIRSVDVDLAGGWVNVPGSQIKNGHGMRLRIGADAIEAVRAIFDVERELLFARPRDLSTWNDHFRAIVAAAGVPPSRRANGLFHKLRRTTVTHTAAIKGMAAAVALAGHSTQYVTERYIDPRFMPNSDATAWLPPLAG
jgi:integrase